MWKKIAAAGIAGAAALGGGAAALAATTSPSTPSQPAPSSTSSAKAKAHHHAAALTRLKSLEHAEWVTGNGTKNVTHDAIKGTVSAISPSSVVVKAADGTSMTFRLDAQTKLVLRENGKGSAKKGTASEVKVNDHVLVGGTKSGSTITAQRLLDTGAK